MGWDAELSLQAPSSAGQGNPAWHPGTAKHNQISGQLTLMPGTKLIMGSADSLDSHQNVSEARTPAGFSSGITLQIISSCYI